jgi:hypothetical protein
MYKDEITPAEYQKQNRLYKMDKRPNAPTSAASQMAVVLQDGTSVYCDWIEFGLPHIKVGWVAGSWTQLHHGVIDHISAV